MTDEVDVTVRNCANCFVIDSFSHMIFSYSTAVRKLCIHAYLHRAFTMAFTITMAMAFIHRPRSSRTAKSMSCLHASEAIAFDDHVMRSLTPSSFTLSRVGARMESP